MLAIIFSCFMAQAMTRPAQQEIEGYLQAANAENASFVLTYTPDQKNLFARTSFKLLPTSFDLQSQFRTLHPNDKVKVSGVVNKGAMAVQSLEVILSFLPEEFKKCEEKSVGDFEFSGGFTEALVYSRNNSNIILQVGDQIFPTRFHGDTSEIALGDLLFVNLNVFKNKKRIIEATAKTFRIKQKLSEHSAEISGNLAMVSIQGKMSFAVEEVLAPHLKRYYPLTNATEVTPLGLSLKNLWKQKSSCQLSLDHLAATSNIKVEVTAQSFAQMNVQASAVIEKSEQQKSL